jgi:2-oxoglutarate ferredoxin oxidoreductase subunit alpha
VLRRFDKVIVPELNMGQLSKLIRAEFLIDAQSITKMQGQPFRSNELEQMILERM